MAKDRVDERGRRANVVKDRRNAGQRNFYIALGAIALVGVAALAYKMNAGGRAAEISTVGVVAKPAEAKPYTIGKPDAPVTVIEFADFECPGCGQYATLTEPDVRQRLVDGGVIQYHYYDYPLTQHLNSLFASNAASCADDQGKFWPMHDALFNGQPNWNGEASRDPKAIFRGYAKDIGLDVSKWEQCYDSHPHLARILSNRAYGESLKVNQTPTFIIGKRQMPGALTYDRFKLYVDSALADAGVKPAAADSARKKSTGP